METIAVSYPFEVDDPARVISGEVLFDLIVLHQEVPVGALIVASLSKRFQLYGRMTHDVPSRV